MSSRAPPGPLDCSTVLLLLPTPGRAAVAVQVREMGWLPPRHGVYVSRWHHGSPAHRYGLYALHYITGGWG